MRAFPQQNARHNLKVISNKILYNHKNSLLQAITVAANLLPKF